MADVLYAALTLAGSSAIPERFLDTGWLAGYALIGGAVLDPTIRGLSEPAPRRDQLERGRLWLLAIASLLAPATLAVQTLTGGEAYPLFIAITAAALFGLVVLRMAGLVRRMTPEGETSSAGVAGWDGAESGEALVARTDRALYRAKRSGRDRTVVSGAITAAAA